MIQKTRVMLYVNDVEMICRFFVEKIGAEVFTRSIGTATFFSLFYE